MIATRPLRPLSLTALAVTFALAGSTPAGAQDAGELFQDACAECHSGAQSGRTPTRFSLSQLTPRAIVAALSDGGVMRSEGEELSAAQRIMLGEYLTAGRIPKRSSRRPPTVPTRAPGGLAVNDIAWMGYGGRPGRNGLPARRSRGPRRRRHRRPGAPLGVRLPGRIAGPDQADRRR